MSNAAITLAAANDIPQAPDWQRLWLSTRSAKRTWRSLALVPAGPGVSPEVFVRIAVALARTGMLHVGTPIHVADATQLTLAQLEPFSQGMEWHTRGSEIILLALGALSDNVTALPLAKAADSALLCVVLDKMSTVEAKRTIAQVGASRFIGSAVFRLPDDEALVR